MRENKSFCWNWVQQNWGDTLFPALRQHVELTLIAVVIGFAIAFTLALVAHRRGWVERPVTIVTGVLYTIPSLALFQLLVPITGLSRLTVEIALVSYTLLILFRNTLAGLRDVPVDVREAAQGMGLTGNQVLWRVELPLALPTIIAGLRIATVTVISLATVAAFVVDEGLGAPIFAAIQQNVFKTELYRGRRAGHRARAPRRRAARPRPAARDAVGLAEAAGMNDILDAFTFIGNNSSLLFDKTVQQLWISALALVISIAIGVPLGVWLGHIHRGSFVAINISNVGRALPSLAVIAIAIALLGLGFGTLMLALVVLAVPPILTNAYVAVDGVDRDIVDAARGMGMRERDILFGIELPLALPLMFAGIRTAAVYVIATATLGALVGTDGGLGEIIVNQASYRLAGVIAAAICVALWRSSSTSSSPPCSARSPRAACARTSTSPAVQTAAGSKQPQEIPA